MTSTVTNINFGIQLKKTIRDGQIYSPYSQFLGKGFNFERKWFSSGREFFNEAICQKVRNKNFNLKAFSRQYYHVEKKGNGYATGHLDQKKALGNRGYLMLIIFDKTEIWVTPNEMFYMTANAAPMRGKLFLTQNGMKYMGSYTLNVNDQKELRSMLPNFQLKVFH